MNVKLDIVNLTKVAVDKRFLKKIAEDTAGLFSPQAREIKISLVLLEKEKMKEINRDYRRKNKPTDVLSFLYTSGYNKKKGRQKTASLEGEIFLCASLIQNAAKRSRISFKEELAFVFSHGILHLLGMRHGQKMYALQDKVVSRFKK